MGRKKKIELLEKPEPSKSLPNYEFEKRKWNAYNDLREGSSYRKAAAQHKISYRCLFDYARGKKNRVESHERYMALPVELENELASRIAIIVKETGIFPQQKVISQLANDLIRLNAEADNSGDAAPTEDPAKPAVSDTWVSKFLRRHPELNYERRGKRRKTDSNNNHNNPGPVPEDDASSSTAPGLTPVIINNQYSQPYSQPLHSPHLQQQQSQSQSQPQRSLPPHLAPPSQLAQRLPNPIAQDHHGRHLSHVHQHFPYPQPSTLHHHSGPPPIPSESHPFLPYPSTPASPHRYSLSQLPQQQTDALSSNGANSPNYPQQQSQSQSQQQQQQQQQQANNEYSRAHSQQRHSIPQPPANTFPVPPNVVSPSSTSTLPNISLTPFMEQFTRPQLSEQELTQKTLNDWYHALTATMDTFSIHPRNVYNVCSLNLSVDDTRGCLLLRNIAARVTPSMTLSTSNTIPFSTANAYGLTIFECICADGTNLTPVVVTPPESLIEARPGALEVLKNNSASCPLPNVKNLKRRSGIPRVARSYYFLWLKQHFDVATRSHADNGTAWRVLITEETPSIDLFFFLWALRHKILVVVVPARIAHATQPFDRGFLVDKLRNKVVDLISANLKNEQGLQVSKSTALHPTGSGDSNRRNSSSAVYALGHSNVVKKALVNASSNSGFSFTKAVPVATLVDSYIKAHNHVFETESIPQEAVHDAWKNSGIVPRNPVLVVNSIRQIPVIESEEVIIQVEGVREHNDGLVAATKATAAASSLASLSPPQINTLFPSVSMLERGIDIFHHDRLENSEKALLLFQLLQSSFDRAVGRDLSLAPPSSLTVTGKRKRTDDKEHEGESSSEEEEVTLDVAQFDDYDYDYDYEEAEQILGYEEDVVIRTGYSNPQSPISSDGSSSSSSSSISGERIVLKSETTNVGPDLSHKLRQYLHPSRASRVSKSVPLTIEQVEALLKTNGFNV